MKSFIGWRSISGGRIISGRTISEMFKAKGIVQHICLIKIQLFKASCVKHECESAK